MLNSQTMVSLRTENVLTTTLLKPEKLSLNLLRRLVRGVTVSVSISNPVLFHDRLPRYFTLCLSLCSRGVSPTNPTIQQGKVLTDEMILTLQLGFHNDQVKSFPL